MVHTRRPLQEKMALFWHNHFATAYSKVVGEVGDSALATRMFAAKPEDDSSATTGQLEVFREYALGNFRDLLVAMAKDPAMLVWLDGRTNVRNRPQENFARELMELFTLGVGRFEETDVYAGARVFTGWNLAFLNRNTPQARYEFAYNGNQHDTTAKEFTFPIYRDGGRVIPARSAADGMQDGLDLIDAVARHPDTGPRLARKLYAYFVNEVDTPDQSLIDSLSRSYYSTGFEILPMVRQLLLSSQFRDPSNYFKRYSWPVEFVARSIKEVGWRGFSVNSALTPLVNMGQQLFEPPDVNGWELGPGWFSSGSMLARMNFAAVLATNQRFNLRDLVRGQVDSPESLLSFMLDRLTPPEFASDAQSALFGYAVPAAPGPARTRSSRPRRRAWRTSLPDPASTSSSSETGSLMSMTRREFVRGGVAAFTVSFAAPAFLTDIARAQGRSRRNLVVLYLSGGNDGLSTLIPYTDQQVLRPAADARHSRGERAADRIRRRWQRARA